MRKIFYLCILSGLVWVIASCGNNKAQSETNTIEDIIKDNHRYDTTMVRTPDDSTAILKMAIEYLELLKQNKIDEALDLLYEVDGDIAKPLSASRKNVLRNNLKKYPVLSYTIDEFRLYSDMDTDVRFTYDFMVKPEGAPENLPTTMKGALNPFRVNGNWYLSISELMNDTEMNDMENENYSTNITEENENN